MCVNEGEKGVRVYVCAVGLSDSADKVMALLNLVNLVESFCFKFH